MMMGEGHFADRLIASIERAGSPVCVGIDPVLARLPVGLRGEGGSEGDVPGGIRTFCSGVIDAVADHVAAVKFQSACFERYRGKGVEVLYSLIGEAKRRRLVVILDAKRGDIGLTAEHYAAGIFGNSDDDEGSMNERPDAVTVNTYLGMDGVEPFAEIAGAGVFALVRTSNAGSDAIQGMVLAENNGETVAEHVAGLVDELARKYVGRRGYSSVGAVVGATKRGDMERLRSIMSKSFFLVPGYGVQGGTADDVRACFDSQGLGALITASRSVLYAFEEGGDSDWREAVGAAAKKFNREVAAVAGVGGSGHVSDRGAS